MRVRCYRIALNAALVTVFSATVSHAATRARFRAETILNDSVVRISAGFEHSCQVNEDGTVRCWGANYVGQLGNGSTSSTRVPVLVSGLTTAVAVSAAAGHTCALLANGTARCWGSNAEGQLGDGTTTNRLTAVAVVGLSNAVAIETGIYHTCALLADSSARCWGYNAYGQLGDATTTNRLTPVAVTGLSRAVAIAPGHDHTCALLADGTAKCWGRNDQGQLGDGTPANRLTPVGVVNLSKAIAITSREGDHSCALLADGTAKCWGRNDFGQVGDGTTTDKFTPAAVSGLSNTVAIATSSRHTCALLANGTAKCWGKNDEGQLGDRTTATRLNPVPVFDLGNAAAIAAGGVHTCALLADGSAKCWGRNISGQLGDEAFPFSSTPLTVAGGGGSFTARDIAAGRNHTCAVRANGTVACWGNNDSGQIGDGAIGGNRLSPVAVSGLSNVVGIAAGEAHTCALLANGTARCWGLNSSGQLGNGTTSNSPTSVTVSGLTNAIGIATGGGLGNSHTCALLADGTARCWGANSSGQIGDGTTAGRLTPVPVSGLTNAVSIAAGEFHTCALVAVGVPFCWGFNSSGQLGNGNTLNQLTPILASVDFAVGIAAGSAHTCALVAVAGNAHCWGGNLLGQLGNTTTTSRSTPGFVSNIVNAVGIAGGFGHSCASLADGTARCWGDNSAGQLGSGSTVSSLIPTTVVKVIQSLTTIRIAFTNIVQITTGHRHSCALFSSGAVNCWGENTFGQLGIGSTANQLSPASVPSFTLNIDPTVTLKDNGRVTTVMVVATCEAGQDLHVKVSLTQGDAAGSGNGSGRCTGGLTRYPVTVPAFGPNRFLEGPAQVSASAIIRDGSDIETQEWTRKVNIVREP